MGSLIENLLLDATPLPWMEITGADDGSIFIYYEGNKITEMSDADASLICLLRNSAPAVLKYMGNGHSDQCFDSPDIACTCGYAALAQILGFDTRLDELLEGGE